MSFELHSERQAYVEVLEHEVKKVVRMIRAFPADRLERRDPDCARSARELAAEFVTRVWQIEELTYGRVAAPFAAASRTRADILLELETAAMSAVASLSSLPSSRWGEVVEAPPALQPWRQARRGELLWRSLREMVRHDRHFALHLRAARHDGGSAQRTAPSPEPLDTLALRA